MLTPRFSVSQEDDFVIINIEAPFAHVKETEVFMEGNLFTFYSSPYYLRLHFSGCIVENEKASARFDADKKGFVIYAPKVVFGEKFENLDMLTSLLAPKGARNISKNIEVLSESYEDGSDSGSSELDWFVEQEIPSQKVVLSGEKYGFVSEHSGVFARLQSELTEVIDVEDPDSKTAKQRSSERKCSEQKYFNEDHYLADTFEEEATLGNILKAKSSELFGSDDLCKEFKDLLISMKPKHFKLTSEELKQAGLTLVDIMFAYCYDKRTTGGESNVESGWSVSKLSASLSWLEKHTSLTETLITCFRRSLTYPLYRNWKLSNMVLEDVRWLFKRGRKQMLKALLEVHQMFVESEPRYILNQLYIDEMCVWIQQADEAFITSLSEALQSASLVKRDVNLDLEVLESAAGQVLTEAEAEETNIAGSMQKLALDSDDSETDSSDSSTDSDSSDSDSDSDSRSESTKAIS